MRVSLNSENSNKGQSLIKSLLLYLFVAYFAFVVADLILLKYVRPHFQVAVSKKDLQNIQAGRERETGPFNNSEIDSKASYTDKVISRNIFNSGEMPPPVASQQPDSQEQEWEDNDPVLTSLPLTLEGTAVHRNPFRSIATMSFSGKTESYSVGDQINNDAEVISVIRKKVIFRNLRNKKLEYVEISRDQPARPQQASRPNFRRPKVNSGSGLVKREGNRFRAKRSDVDKQLGNISQLLRQANSRPATDPATGELLGYEIFQIQPGSLYEQLGIQNGDIITSINGMKITNPAKAMTVYNQLKSSSEINATVNRGGREMDLEYIIE